VGVEGGIEAGVVMLKKEKGGGVVFYIFRVVSRPQKVL